MYQRDGDVLLPGIGIGGYRSMPGAQFFAPLGKVSLLAGQNNVGKSNVIRFLERYYSARAPRRVWEDEPQVKSAPLEMSIAYRLDEDKYSEWVAARGQRQKIDSFLALPSFHPTSDEDLFWVPRTQANPSSGGFTRDDGSVEWEVSARFLESLNQEGTLHGVPLQALRSGLFNTTGGPVVDNMLDVIKRLFPLEDLPKVEVIHAFRRVVADPGASDNSGIGLPRTLAGLQHPEARDRHQMRAKFDAINRFLKTVMEDESVEIEIPANAEHVQIHQGGLVFPLEDLGTGIHQVLILATAATLLDRALVCIEEPEVNLHPILQRKFVRYLTDHTSNQYVIATHSAHMLDFERASVIHVRKTSEGTVPSHATRTQAVADVCADLGYRPSDVLQANAVIWVEGPSDRTYLQHWLRSVEPESPYIEGIHYSIMFYGGAMLSHLTGEDPMDDVDVREFITLRRLNRHSMIVIDSDKRTPRAALNPTKKRVIEEFDRDDLPGHAWVTAGYTIENYVPTDILKVAVKSVHPQAVHQYEGEKWSNPLAAQSGTGNGKAISLHKVRVAAAVVEQWDESTPLTYDLKKRVRAVHDFIEQANI